MTAASSEAVSRQPRSEFVDRGYGRGGGGGGGTDLVALALLGEEPFGVGLEHRARRWE